MKRQGVKAGVVDVILLVPKKGYVSLCLEFKTSTGRQADEQIEFQRQAEACRSKYVVVRSVAQAIEVLKEYLSLSFKNGRIICPFSKKIISDGVSMYHGAI